MTLLSIVVPTHDRGPLLGSLLESLARQTLAADAFEVIVVDDGSADDTAEIVSRAILSAPLRVISRAHQGRGAARNAGAAAACAPFVLFLDDDVVASPELAARHLEVQRRHGGAVAVGGVRLQVPDGGGPLLRHDERARRRHFERLERNEREPTWVDCYGANMSVPREALLHAGGFAEDFPAADDAELAYRLTRDGLPVAAVAAAVDEISRTDERAVLADAVRRGAAATELYRRHPATIETLQVGSPLPGTLLELLLRRALIRLRVAPSLLLTASAPLPKRVRARSDKALLRYAYWYGVRSTVSAEEWRRLNWRTPILMYHAVAGPDEPASRYVVPLASFTRQLRWLARRGYRFVSLQEYLEHRRAHRLAPARSIVLTFDDGYRDTGTLAWPALEQLQAPGTLFVVTRRMGAVADWEMDGGGAALAGRQLLDAAELRRLAARGLELGAHTRTHPVLPSLSAEAAAAEISGSRADLEERVDVRPPAFAYPYGRLDGTSEQLVRDAGFAGACSVDYGLNDALTPRYRLRRLEVYGTDPLPVFAVAVLTGDLRLVRRLRALTRLILRS